MVNLVPFNKEISPSDNFTLGVDIARNVFQLNAYPKSDCELSADHDTLFTEGNHEISTSEVLQAFG